MRLLALMENVRDFVGNRATKAPRAPNVNRILQMTLGILYTTRAIPNLASARTTASPQRERQTAKPARREPMTKIPFTTTTKLATHTTTNESRPSTADTIATFEKEPQRSRVQTISEDPSSNPDILQAPTRSTQVYTWPYNDEKRQRPA